MSAWKKFRKWIAGTKQPSGSAALSSWSLFGGLPRKGTRELFSMYRISPWLFAVENRLATERAVSCRWKLWDGHRDDSGRSEILSSDPRKPLTEILQLLRRPTLTSSGRVISQYSRDKLLALWVGLTGEAYLFKQRNNDGSVVGLVPVNPLWVTRLPTIDRPTYEIQVTPGFSEQRPPADVIPIIDLDPENPYGRGLGVAYTLGDEIETDEGCSALARAQLQNMGIPAGLIVVDGASHDALTQLKAKWGGGFSGPDNAGKYDFTDAEDIKLLQFTSTPDLFEHSIEMRRFLRDTFIQVHGLSPEIFGVLDSSSQESAYVAYYHLALGSLVPWLNMLSAAYQAHLLPDFDLSGNVFLDYISPVPEDKSLRLRCVATAPSAFRGSDVRQIGGFAPDAELDKKVLGAETPRATPTQLPPSPGDA